MSATSVATQLADAGSLLLVGMVVVFSFLSLLIVAVHGLTWLCQALPGEGNPNLPNTDSSKSALAGVPPEHVAAITAAIAMHHKK